MALPIWMGTDAGFSICTHCKVQVEHCFFLFMETLTVKLWICET